MSDRRDPQRPTALSHHLAQVRRYYDRTESRVGYTFLLGGTKHFGYYQIGQSRWKLRTAMRQMEHELAKRLNLAKNSVILDAGCGVGDVSRALARQLDAQVIGVDILDFNIDAARRRSDRDDLTGQTRFEVADYHRLPFDEGTFDGAILVETLVHAADFHVVLSELLRVLKPGGRLVMAEYSRTADSKLSADTIAAMHRIFAEGAMPAWEKFEQGVLLTALRDTGFVDVSEEDVTERMLPMLSVFYILGRFPYWLMTKVGKSAKAVNAMSGVETFRHQDAWRYNLYTANTPRF